MSIKGVSHSTIKLPMIINMSFTKSPVFFCYWQINIRYILWKMCPQSLRNISILLSHIKMILWRLGTYSNQWGTCLDNRWTILIFLIAQKAFKQYKNIAFYYRLGTKWSYTARQSLLNDLNNLEIDKKSLIVCCNDNNSKQLIYIFGTHKCSLSAEKVFKK